MKFSQFLNEVITRDEVYPFISDLEKRSYIKSIEFVGSLLKKGIGNDIDLKIDFKPIKFNIALDIIQDIGNEIKQKFKTNVDLFIKIQEPWRLEYYLAYDDFGFNIDYEIKLDLVNKIPNKIKNIAKDRNLTTSEILKFANMLENKDFDFGRLDYYFILENLHLYMTNKKEFYKLALKFVDLRGEDITKVKYIIYHVETSGSWNWGHWNSKI